MVDLVTYDVDAADTIRGVGGRWAEFAVANGGAHLVAGVLGRPLWDFVAGATTRHMYGVLCARVRQGHTVSFQYRCDSPTTRRYMRMRLVPVEDGGVRFESETLMTRSWPPALLESTPSTRRDVLVRLCSWCKKGLIDGVWEELEVVVERLGMFFGDTESPVSHGICPTCATSLEEAIAASRPIARG